MPSISLFSGSLQQSVSQRTTQFSSQSTIQRLWSKDHTIWRSEEVHKKSILNRLGWLNSLDLMLANAGALKDFANEIRTAGFTHTVVLGMGGSSLCPDVCRATFGSAPGFPQLLVLDSTNPMSVQRVEQQIDLKKTLFIVASKSGGTTETNMFYQYFYGRVSSLSATPGDQFIAVTDANTKMEGIAKEKKFRRIFINPEDIGGRYSALSYFGLVPMALIGMDIDALLQSADEMRKQCRFETVQNPAAQIGIMMGEAYHAGLDKLTFVLSKGIATFGYWAEQLIAESTGKEGKGILPLEGERIGEQFDPVRFGGDRTVVFILLKDDANDYPNLMKELEARNIPYAVILLDKPSELGSQFFLWEFATAVSAVVLGINPFDEPNVKESKDNTVSVIGSYQKEGKLPVKNLVVSDGRFTIFGEQDYAAKLSAKSVAGFLKQHCQGKMGEDYIAILAYVDQNPGHERLLYALREELTTLTGLPVTVGFGPRYLHSTGQLHKGGGPNGIFLIISAEEPKDLPIPGEVFTYGILKDAQALGDYQSFANRGLRLLHLRMTGPVADGLAALQPMFLQ